MATQTGHGLGSDELIASADRAASSALKELPDALVVVFDADLRVVLAAGAPLARLSDPAALAKGQGVGDAFPGEIWQRLEPLFRSALAGETRTREIWTPGDSHCLMVDVGPLAGEGEQRDGAGVAVVLDITDRRRADLLDPHWSDGFEEVFEFAPIGTGLLDLEGRWLLVNRALCDITGYTAQELVGRRFDGIVHPEDVQNDLAERERLLADEAPAYQVEKRFFDAAGETVNALLSMSLIRDRGGEPLHYVAQLQDVSQRRDLEEHQRRLADHDQLTGLRNRRLFEQDLRLQVARCQRYGEVAGLMLIDIEGFREINRRFGVDAGDETLRAVARALMRRLRETDLVARLGGDELAVLVPHADEEGMAVVAEGLSRVIPAASVDVGEKVLHPTASIGWTLIRRGSGSAREALVRAERSMHEDRRA